MGRSHVRPNFQAIAMTGDPNYRDKPECDKGMAMGMRHAMEGDVSGLQAAYRKLIDSGRGVASAMFAHAN
jgi:hypothetical protein